MVVLLSVADQWDVQSIVKRIVAELQSRSYLVWFDRASLPLLPCSHRTHATLRSAQLSSHTRAWMDGWMDGRFVQWSG